MGYYKEYFDYVVEHRRNVRKAADYWEKKWIEMFPRIWLSGEKRKLKREIRKIKMFHDWNKFLPCEFKPYADYFYGENGVKIERDFPNDDEPYTNGMSCLSRRYLKVKNAFDNAWSHHYETSNHHWEKYYHEVCFEHMPTEYIREMIIDWSAMSYKFGGSPQEFYLNNYQKIQLHRDSRHCLEINLGLLNFNGPVCEGNVEYWSTLGELKRMGCNLNEIIIYPELDFDDYDIK